jgi:gluconolactonase
MSRIETLAVPLVALLAAAIAVPLAFLLLATAAGRPTAPDEKSAFRLEAQSPQFWKIVTRDAKLSTVATGFGFTEGPVWDPAGFLYVSDETLNKIFRVRLNGTKEGTKEALIDLGDPDGNTFDSHHRLLDCASVLRAIIAITPGGQYTILADRLRASGSTVRMT